MQTVSPSQVVDAREAVEEPLPPRIQEALGQLVGAAKEGLLALSVGVGLGVLEELMAEEVEEICGPRGKHDPDRAAYRHGTDEGAVTLGGRRVPVARPRMRTKDSNEEVPVRTYEHFASRDPLSRVVLERMLAGVSTRRYPRAQEPVGEQVVRAPRSTSKSAVSRTFIARTKEALLELMARSLADIRLAVLMIDGVGLKDHTCVVALGITTDGVKIPLGLWEGSTENKTVTSELLSNLVHRGLDVEQGVLVVIDGSKALRAAVNDVLGTRTPVQRCQIHKQRNVLDHLAERDRDLVKRRLRRAWAEAERWSSSRRSPQSWSARTPARPRRSGRGWPRR
jgi:putative transposase